MSIGELDESKARAEKARRFRASSALIPSDIITKTASNYRGQLVLLGVKFILLSRWTMGAFAAEHRSQQPASPTAESSSPRVLPTQLACTSPPALTFSNRAARTQSTPPASLASAAASRFRGGRASTQTAQLISSSGTPI